MLTRPFRPRHGPIKNISKIKSSAYKAKYFCLASGGFVYIASMPYKFSNNLRKSLHDFFSNTRIQVDENSAFNRV